MGMQRKKHKPINDISMSEAKIHATEGWTREDLCGELSFSEYRALFETTEQFKRAFGQLSKEEAYALIDRTGAAISIKACIASVWQKCVAEFGNDRKDITEEE